MAVSYLFDNQVAAVNLTHYPYYDLAQQDGTAANTAGAAAPATTPAAAPAT